MNKKVIGWLLVAPFVLAIGVVLVVTLIEIFSAGWWAVGLLIGSLIMVWMCVTGWSMLT